MIYAVAAVAIIIVAAVAVYYVTGDHGNGGKDSSDAHAVLLDDVEATETNVNNGTYGIQRNLVLVTSGEPTGNVAAFLSWITSEEGQTILGEEFVKLKTYTTEVKPSESGDTTIVMGGSTSLSETAEKLAAAYMAKYPFMKITIQGGGSGVGETGALSGDFEIGMLSRDMSSKYEGQLVPVTIGKDGVAVIVNVNGVDGLTSEQVAKIFSGEITNWNQVGGPDKKISVIIREDGSGTRECFDKAMAKVDEGWKAMTDAASCNSTGLVIKNVQTTEGSIGYISIGQVKNLGGTTEVSGPHAVTLNNVKAEESNVLNGTYPIQRNLVLVTNGEPAGNTAAFLSWITSAEGQAILGEEFVKLESFTTETAPSESGDTTIIMGGSTSLSETAEKLAAAYMAKYPFMKITIQGGGSGVGETGALSGDFEIGMLSRDMSSKYEGQLVPVTIGKDGVAIIANISGVENLSIEDVAKIFSGEITNWSQVGGPDKKISVIIREDGSGTRECFDKAMAKVDEGWKAMTDAASCNSTGLVIKNVQTTEGSIGYISIGQVANL